MQNKGIPYITPVIRRGNKIKRLLIGRKARCAEYIMKNPQKKEVQDYHILQQISYAALNKF
ncbi:hypothetical protein [uncultured Methanolobus sp.]|uniref:hypothetical protein n=1 Tax=uncultured Methanolobus sp. TaxID=218300 RepID=UPI002AABF2A0|nr:hypothetical protein [uncultured Methanolobus sp.]